VYVGLKVCAAGGVYICSWH